MENGKVSTQYFFPENPDIFTGESHSEFFIRYWSTNKTSTYKNLPVQYQHVLSKLVLFRRPVKPTDISETVQIKFNEGKYLSESSGLAVLSATPQDWQMIFHPANSRIVLLYLPNKGYLSVKPGTQKLIISQEQPRYFLKTLTREGLRLQTLVEFTGKESGKPMDEMFETNLLWFWEIFQKAGIVTPEMEQLYKMLNVSIKFMNIRYILS